MLTMDIAEEIKRTGAGVITPDGARCWITDIASDGETVTAHVVGVGVDRWEDLLDLTPAMQYEVHTGRPSWHQQRAGAISAGITVFGDRGEAETCVANAKSARPGEPAFIVERPTDG